MSDWQMTAIDRESKVHSALKHRHILELIGAAKLSPEQAARGGYLPAYYLLMEMAAGGDLFDKIGKWPRTYVMSALIHMNVSVPDVGINEEIAHWYFCQMLAGLVRAFVSCKAYVTHLSLLVEIHSRTRRCSSGSQARESPP